jgi:hypothetical protein
VHLFFVVRDSSNQSHSRKHIFYFTKYVLNYSFFYKFKDNIFWEIFSNVFCDPVYLNINIWGCFMLIFNAWCCYLKFVFLCKINSFCCTCSYSILCIYCSFLYFRIFFDIQNVKSYIFFSIPCRFEKKYSSPKHHSNLNMVYIWTTNNLVRYINMDTF